MLILNIDPRTEYFPRYELPRKRGNAPRWVHRHRGLREGWTRREDVSEVNEKTVTAPRIFFSALRNIKYYVNSREIRSLSRTRMYYIYSRGTRVGTATGIIGTATHVDATSRELRREALRNLLRGRGSVLLQRITRLATSLVPSLMPRASYRRIGAVIKLTSNGNTRLFETRLNNYGRTDGRKM